MKGGKGCSAVDRAAHSSILDLTAMFSLRAVSVCFAIATPLLTNVAKNVTEK